MNDYLRNNNIGLLAITVTGGILLVTYYCAVSRFKSDDEVHCVLKCKCGKVSAEVNSRRSTPSATCHCNDCVNFVNWVKAPSQEVRPSFDQFFFV